MIRHAQGRHRPRLCQRFIQLLIYRLRLPERLLCIRKQRPSQLRLSGIQERVRLFGLIAELSRQRTRFPKVNDRYLGFV